MTTIMAAALQDQIEELENENHRLSLRIKALEKELYGGGMGSVQFSMFFLAW